MRRDDTTPGVKRGRTVKTTIKTTSPDPALWARLLNHARVRDARHVGRIVVRLVLTRREGGAR